MLLDLSLTNVAMYSGNKYKLIFSTSLRKTEILDNYDTLISEEQGTSRLLLSWLSIQLIILMNKAHNAKPKATYDTSDFLELISSNLPSSFTACSTFQD